MGFVRVGRKTPPTGVAIRRRLRLCSSFEHAFGECALRARGGRHQAPDRGRMIASCHRGGTWVAALGGAIALALAAMPATAGDTIRIAAQKTGTLAWELAVIR